jgi:hypothetical protein
LELKSTHFRLGSGDVYLVGEDSKIRVKAPQINAEGVIKLYNTDSELLINEDQIELNATKILVNGVSLSATVAQEVEPEDTSAISSAAVIKWLECYPKWPQMSAYVDVWMTLQIPDNNDKRPNRATRASAVVDYVASQLANYKTATELTTALADYTLATTLADYYTKTDMATVLGGFATTQNITNTNSKFSDYTTTVNLNLKLANYALKSELPPTPTIEFKTEFIVLIDNDWKDLSTCWILLNVCHIEFNLIFEQNRRPPGGGDEGYAIGILQIGMPKPSGTVITQLAGLSGILTLRLMPEGIIYVSDLPPEITCQISASIFYTFTEYITEHPPFLQL